MKVRVLLVLMLVNQRCKTALCRFIRQKLQPPVLLVFKRLECRIIKHDCVIADTHDDIVCSDVWTSLVRFSVNYMQKFFFFNVCIVK